MKKQVWNGGISSKKWFLLRFIFLLVVLVLSVFLAYLTFHTQKQGVNIVDSSNTTTQEPVITDTSNWKKFANEKYGFYYLYPESAVDRDKGIYYPLLVDQADDDATKKISLENFAKETWTRNKNQDTHNNYTLVISPLKKISLNGREGYTFNLQGAFALDNKGSGYLLEKEYTYTLLQNNYGTKFIIRFPSDSSIDAKVLETFTLDEKTIPPKVDAANWVTVINNVNDFTYQYPKNILTLPNDNPTADWFVSGKRGSFSVRVIPQAFDPENIQGMYGKIEEKDTEKVAVGGAIGYAYGWGDAGCFARIIDMGLSQTKTLRITFGSCEEDMYYIATDKDLQNEILSRFNFTP